MTSASQQAQIDKYNRRSPEAKHLLQLSAINYDGINRTDMVTLSQHCGWRDSDGKKLDYKEVRTQIEAMVNDGLLVRGAGGSLSVHRLLMDYVVQEAIRSGDFERFAAKIQETKPRGEYYRYYYGRDQFRFQRDLRIAFYRSDVAGLKSLAKNATVTFIGSEDGLGVLTPFDVNIFASLDPILQQQYLIEALLNCVADRRLFASTPNRTGAVSCQPFAYRARVVGTNRRCDCG